MAVKFANLASSTLASSLTNSATSISVTDASSFPTLGAGDYFYASIGEGSLSEIVKVTAVSSNTLTAVRGQDGTTARSHDSGTSVALRVVAAALDDIASAADTESVSIDGDTMTGDLSVPSLTFSGSITGGNSTTAALARVHYSDGGYLDVNGWGLEFNRNNSYLRPNNSGARQLEIGGTNKEWKKIFFKTTQGLYMNGSEILTNARALQNVTADAGIITSGTFDSARIPVPLNGDWWNNGFVRVQTDGVMEVGKYLDFHTSDSGGSADFDVRVTGSPGAIDIDGDLTVDDITSGAITATGNSVITGSGSSGNAFQVKRGNNGNSSFKVLNTGEVLVENNYFYVNTNHGAYFNGEIRVRGGISNDSSSSFGGDVRILDNTDVRGALKIQGVTAIDASRNITAGTISSGALSVSGVHSGGYDVANLYSAATQANVNIGRSGAQRFNFYVTDAGGYIRYYQDETDGTDHSVHFQIQSSSSGTNQFYFNKGVNVTGNISATSYSGALTSSVTATTQSASDNSTKVATTAYVDSAVSGIVDSAPGTLNTLNELAAALGDDANFSTTVTNSIATKLPLAGGTMTGAINMGSNAITSSGIIRANTFRPAVDNAWKIRGNSGNANLAFEYSTSTGLADANIKAEIGNTGNVIFGGRLSQIVAGYQAEIRKASTTIGDGGGAGALNLRATGNFYIRHNGSDALTFNGSTITSSDNFTIANNSSDPTLAFTTTSSSFDPVLQMNGQSGIASEGFEIWYDNTVGDVHLHTTYNHNDASIRFHTKTGASKGTSNERFRIDGSGYTQITSHTNSWDGGLRMVSADGTDTFKIHPDNNGYMYVDKNWYFTGAVSIGSIGQYAWHSGNDGSGSGLDADTVDGVHKTGFMQTGRTFSSSPNTIDNGGDRYNPDSSNPSNEHYAILTYGNGGNVTGQFATHFQTGQSFSRAYNNSWSSWRKQWDASNDGSGSGLDADLLDGHDSGSFLRSNVSDNYTSGTLSFNSGTALKMLNGSNFDASSGDVYVNLRVIRNAGTANTDGLYIGYLNSNSGLTRIFGGGQGSGGIYISGSGANDIKYNNSSVFWHAGNDGSGSGLDADLLDGYHETSFVRLTSSSNSPTNGTFAIGTDGSRNFIQSHSSRPLDLNPLGNTVTIGGTSNTAWHAGNDGSGSGLDADKLDNLHASSFLRSDAADTATGNLTFTGNISQTGGTFLSHGAQVSSLTTAWEAAGTSKDRGLYPFRFQNGATGQPESGDNAHWGLNIYAHAGSSGGYPYGTQLSAGSTQTLWHRWWSNGNAQGWRKVWDSSNDGAGSGLDADNLDGVTWGSYKATGVSQINVQASNGYGLRFWNGNDNYKISMAASNTTGFGRQAYEPNSDYNMYFRMASGTNRGFVFQNGTSNKVGIDASGNIRADGVISSDNKQAMNVAHWSNSGNSTGAIVITLPGTTGNYSMPIIEVVTYEYNSDAHTVYHISGHNWSTAANWYNNRVTATGANPKEVRLGHNGTTHCIIIGTTSEAWAYGHVTVSLKAHPGFYNTGQNMTTGWGISQVTSLSGYSTTVQGINKVWHSGNDGAGSGLDADTIDGLNVHTGRNNEVNKVVRTDNNGYIQAGWINTTSGNEGTTNFDRIYASYDGYIRYYTKANFGSQISSHINYNSLQNKPTIPTNTNQLTNGAGFLTSSNDRIYITDTRGANRAPSYYDDRYVQADFTQNAYLGLNSGVDAWGTALTVSKWAGYDASHRQEQLIFAGTKLARRVATSDSAWSSTYTIWDSSTDGSGSGLDADTLDGQQGSYYQSTSGNVRTLNTYMGSSDGNSLQYWQASGQNSNYAPSGDWYNTIRGGHGNPQTYYSNTLAMKMTGSGIGTIYTQTLSNGTFQGWNKHWHANNDGSGSGLDADLLDGQHGSHYLNAANFTGTAPTGSPFLSDFVHLGNANGSGYSTDDGSWGSRLNVSSTVHAKIEVSQQANSMRSHWYAHTGQDSIKFGTSTGHDVELQRASGTKLKLVAGGSLAYEQMIFQSGGIGRADHHYGHLVGSYNNVAANSAKTNPIYVIGTSYQPTATSFSNMYGVGYAHSNMWGTSSGRSSGWGFYSVDNGTVHFTTTPARTWSQGEFNRNGNKVWDAGNDGPGSGLDADTLDTYQASYFFSPINFPTRTNFENVYNNLSSSTGNGANLNSTFLNDRSGNFDCWSGSNFPPSTSHVQGIQVRHSTGNDYGWQLASQYSQPGKMYLRHVSNGTFYDWYTLWTSANDGPGSGLNADLLDNVEAASFLRSDANDSFSGQLTMSTQKALIASNYGHGVYGVYSASKYQHVWSMGTSYNAPANGASTGTVGNLYGLAWTYNPDYGGAGNNAQAISGLNHQLILCMNGTTRTALGSGIWTEGNVTAYSDRRVKTNIELIPNAVEKVQKLNGYTFDRTDVEEDPATGEVPHVRQTGVIAQEVLEVLPEAVIGSEERGYSVAYGNMVGLLIEAVKELKHEVDDLKAQLAEK